MDLAPDSPMICIPMTDFGSERFDEDCGQKETVAGALCALTVYQILNQEVREMSVESGQTDGGKWERYDSLIATCFCRMGEMDLAYQIIQQTWQSFDGKNKKTSCELYTTHVLVTLCHYVSL